jgi:hypothetical protein
VDELHSIENKSDKSLQKTIDQNFTGCTTQSFFDSFQGFPVGGESGTEVSSPQPRCRAQATGGTATVNSEPLVERTGSKSKAR